MTVLSRKEVTPSKNRTVSKKEAVMVVYVTYISSLLTAGQDSLEHVAVAVEEQRERGAHDKHERDHSAQSPPAPCVMVHVGQSVCVRRCRASGAGHSEGGEEPCRQRRISAWKFLVLPSMR